MTSTLSPEDTGDIAVAETRVIVHPQPYLSVVDTERIDLGDQTRNLPRKALPPTRALRLADAHPDWAHATGEVPAFPTGAELAVAAQPTPTTVPRPAPGRHALTERVGLFPVVRPSMPLRASVRAARRAADRRDRRAWWASVLLLTSLAAMVLALAVTR